MNSASGHDPAGGFGGSPLPTSVSSTRPSGLTMSSVSMSFMAPATMSLPGAEGTRPSSSMNSSTINTNTPGRANVGYFTAGNQAGSDNDSGLSTSSTPSNYFGFNPGDSGASAPAIFPGAMAQLPPQHYPPIAVVSTSSPSCPIPPSGFPESASSAGSLASASLFPPGHSPQPRSLSMSSTSTLVPPNLTSTFNQPISPPKFTHSSSPFQISAPLEAAPLKALLEASQTSLISHLQSTILPTMLSQFSSTVVSQIKATLLPQLRAEMKIQTEGLEKKIRRLDDKMHKSIKDAFDQTQEQFLDSHMKLVGPVEKIIQGNRKVEELVGESHKIISAGEAGTDVSEGENPVLHPTVHQQLDAISDEIVAMRQYYDQILVRVGLVVESDVEEDTPIGVPLAPEVPVQQPDGDSLADESGASATSSPSKVATLLTMPHTGTDSLVYPSPMSQRVKDSTPDSRDTPITNGGDNDMMIDMSLDVDAEGSETPEPPLKNYPFQTIPRLALAPNSATDVKHTPSIDSSMDSRSPSLSAPPVDLPVDGGVTPEMLQPDGWTQLQPNGSRARSRSSSLTSLSSLSVEELIKAPQISGKRPRETTGDESVASGSGTRGSSKRLRSAAPSVIWPPLIEVSSDLTQQRIYCDTCQSGYHWECVSLQEGDTEPQQFICPICTFKPADQRRRPRKSSFRDDRCCRPDCPSKPVPGKGRKPKIKEEEKEFVIQGIVGRRGPIGKFEYLIEWAGYGPKHCEWKMAGEFRPELLLPEFESACEKEGLDTRQPSGTLVLKRMVASGYWGCHAIEAIVGRRKARGQSWPFEYLCKYADWEVDNSEWRPDRDLTPAEQLLIWRFESRAEKEGLNVQHSGQLLLLKEAAPVWKKFKPTSYFPDTSYRLIV